MFISKKDLDLINEKLDKLVGDLRAEIEKLKEERIEVKPTQPRQTKKKAVN